MRWSCARLVLVGLAAGLWAGADPHPALPPATVFAFRGSPRAAAGNPDDPATDPDGHDADGNGLPDAWEIAYFGAAPCDPDADPDADGWSTGEEYWSGRHPTLPDRESEPGTNRLRVFTP